MAQRYREPFEYKGLTVNPRPQRPAQYYPNTPQSSTPKECERVPFEPDFSGVGRALGSIGAGFLDILDEYRERRSYRRKYSRLRKYMERENEAHRAQRSTWKSLNQRHRQPCSPCHNTQINVSGGVANITINNR